MLEGAVACPELMAYLPDGKEIPQLPRQWLANVIYSVFGNQFAMWIEERIQDRNSKLEVKQNLLINMDPTVAAAFEASKQVSCKCFWVLLRSILTFVYVLV
jgi:hypothetical protein